MKKKQSAFILLIVGMGVCCSVGAHTMFRCGSTYQDQPCSGNEQGRVVGSTGASSSLPAASSDAECARMGEDAKKIVWAREAGTIEEDAMSRAQSAREKDLVQKVYMRRGSSSEVSAAIAADCVSEKEKAAQAAALIQEAQKLSPSSSGTGVADSNDRAASQRNGALVQQSRSANDSQARQQRCDNLSERLENIRNQQRQGGSAAAMEKLNRMQQDAQSDLDSAHCR